MGVLSNKKPKNPYTTKHDRLSDSRCDVLSSSLETRPEPDGTRRRSTAVDDGIEIDPEGEFATKVKEDLAAKIKSFASMMIDGEEMEDIAYDFAVEVLKTAVPVCCIVS